MEAHEYKLVLCDLQMPGTMNQTTKNTHVWSTRSLDVSSRDLPSNNQKACTSMVVSECGRCHGASPDSTHGKCMPPNVTVRCQSSLTAKIVFVASPARFSCELSDLKWRTKRQVANSQLGPLRMSASPHKEHVDQNVAPFAPSRRRLTRRLPDEYS